MAFGEPFYPEQKDGGEIRGIKQRVAVGCWFTSTGRMMPKLLKYQDSQGRICCLEDIRVLEMEEKYYAGSLVRRYDCLTRKEGREYEFLLLFYPEVCSWQMIA